MLWWSDDLKTGVVTIDNQHKNIFDKANEILDLGVNSDIGEIERIFEFLMNYTTAHFSEEEQLMKDYGFEGLEKHKMQHDYFIESISNTHESIRNEGIKEEFLNELKVLTIEWLANHINKDDMEFIEIINKDKNMVN